MDRIDGDIAHQDRLPVKVSGKADSDNDQANEHGAALGNACNDLANAK